MKFTNIKNINDIQNIVANIKEIKLTKHLNDITVACYVYQDSNTFCTQESLECRGIAFDASGNVVSRPLHKFFNIGEKGITIDKLITQESNKTIAAIFEKLDGSMISTAWVDNKLAWRSKKSFTSDVVLLTKEYLKTNKNITEFSEYIASNNHTAIFELTHPSSRIVVEQNVPSLKLLHIRNNYSGEYVLLDQSHEFHDKIKEFNIQTVKRYNMSIHELVDSLTNMVNMEGYIVQFNDGDMVKIKCPWYLRLHKSISMLRERDIALLVINDDLDDVKSNLIEAGIDLSLVNEVETKVKNIFLLIENEIEHIYNLDKDLDRKSFAIKHKTNPLFKLLMDRYAGNESELKEWYLRNNFKTDFTLRVLVDGPVAELI